MKYMIAKMRPDKMEGQIRVKRGKACREPFGSASKFIALALYESFMIAFNNGDVFSHERYISLRPIASLRCATKASNCSILSAPSSGA